MEFVVRQKNRLNNLTPCGSLPYDENNDTKNKSLQVRFIIYKIAGKPVDRISDGMSLRNNRRGQKSYFEINTCI